MGSKWHRHGVMIKETGQRWPSVKAMSEDLGIDMSHLYKKLRGDRGNGGPLSLTIVWAPPEDD